MSVTAEQSQKKVSLETLAGLSNFQTQTEGVYEKRFLAKGKSTVLFNSLATGLDIYILVYPLYEM